MVTVIDYRIREDAEGNPFVALLLQGDLTMVQSQETGRFYATARKCSGTSTFSEETAKSLVGTRLPGQIVREEYEPYDYTMKTLERWSSSRITGFTVLMKRPAHTNCH